MNGEDEWRPVTDFEGLYEVSHRGQVRSLDREVRHYGGGTATRAGQVLKPCPDRYGNLRVNLWRDNRQNSRLVARLVLEAFVGECPVGQEALHGPGGPGDNRWPEALHYGTHGENMLDKHRDGTFTQAKMTPEIVIACRERRARGESFMAISADYPQIHKQTIRDAVLGLTWRHVVAVEAVPL